MTRWSPSPLPVISIAACLLLGGCAATQNHRREIGGMVRLNTTTPENPQRPQGPFDGSPGVDRSDWARRSFNVPIDNSYHQPIYTRSLHVTKATRRQRDEFPTVDSCLETATSDAGRTQAFEAVVAPFAALADVVLFVPRVIAGPAPARTVTSPFEPYERGSRPTSIDLFGVDPHEPVQGATKRSARSSRPPYAPRENDVAVPTVVDLDVTPSRRAIESPNGSGVIELLTVPATAPAPPTTPAPSTATPPQPAPRPGSNDRQPAIREVDPDA